MAGTPWRYQPITERRQQDSEEFQQYAGQRMQEMEQESGGGGGGGLLDSIGGAVGDVAGAIGDVGSAIGRTPVVGESISDVASFPIDAYQTAESGLQTAAGIATGATSAPRRQDPETGAYYRGKPDFGHAASSISELFTDPASALSSGEQAFEERLRNPEHGAIERGLLGGITAPEVYALPGVGGAIGKGLRQAGPIGRGAANLVEPLVGGSYGRRATSELALETGARAGAEVGGEHFGPAGALVGGLGGGLGGAQLGRAIPGSQPFRQGGQQAARQVEDTGQLGSTAIGGSQTRMFRLPDPESRQPLRRRDSVVNTIKDTAGVGTPEDPVMTPIIREYEQLRTTIPDSQATRMESLASEARQVFNQADNGLVLDVQPNATVQDIAARLPNFRSQLNDDQVRYMENMREEFSTLQAELREAGVDVGTRPDVMEGGFYLPRGNAAKEGMDTPRKGSTGAKGRGAKPGALRHATEDSMAEGIGRGYEYSSLEEAVRGYVDSTGKLVYDSHLGNELRNLRGPEGNLLGQTARDRVNPQLRERYQNVQKNIVRLRDKLRRAERREGVEARASDELDNALDDVVRGTPATGFRDVSRIPARLRQEGRRAEGLQGRAGELRSDTMRSPEGFPEARINMPPTESALRRAETSDLRAEEVQRTLKNVDELVPEDLEQVRFMDTAIKNTAQRAEQLAQRGGQARERASQLREQLRAAQEEFDSLRAPMRKELENARATPPDQQTIALSNMNGWTFPVEMAKPINKRLVQESGPIENAIRSINKILRGLAATADASFIGIQGLIGFSTDPKSFAKAVRMAVQSFGDSDVHPKALQELDATYREAGAPTSRDWASQGLRIGAHRTEYQVGGEGLTGQLGRIQELPVIQQSNRAFGNFGDIMRLQLANTIAGRARAQGKNIASPKVMQEIAEVSNLATGWSPRQFGGRAGEWSLFAPRFFQSQLELTAKAFANGDISGGQARRGLLTMIGIGSTMTVVANETLPDGMTPEEYAKPFRGDGPIGDPTQGFSSNFMRIRGGGMDISLFGTWDSLLRLVTTTATGAVTGDMEKLTYGQSKASPLLRMTIDLIKGEDFVGDEASLTNFEYMAKQLAPISVAQIWQDWGDTGLEGKGLLVGSEMAGMKTTPVSSYEKAQNIFNASDETYKVPDAEGNFETATSYWDLNNAQRQKFENDHPEIAADLKSDPSEELQQYNQVKEMLAKEQQVSDMALIQNEIGIDEWRDQFNDRRTFLRGAGEALFEGGEEGEVNSTDDLYNQIIEENTLPDGGVDWDEVDQRVSKLTPAQQQWIADNRSPGMTNLTQRYLSTSDQRNKYFNLPKYRGYSGDEARQIDDIYDRARATLNLPRGQKAPQMRMLRAIREVQQQYGFDPKVARGARRRVMGMMTETDDREQFLQNNPEVAAFVGSGYLSPDEQNVIGGVDSVLRDAERTR